MLTRHGDPNREGVSGAEDDDTQEQHSRQTSRHVRTCSVVYAVYVYTVYTIHIYCILYIYTTLHTLCAIIYYITVRI